MEHKKLVLFDFDGVLVNTCDFWYGLHKASNATLTWERFESMSHGNFITTMKKIFAEEDYVRPERAEEKFAEALQTVFSIEDILHDCILHLSSMYTLAIVSSSSSETISAFIKKENLEGCFQDILGYEMHSSKTVKIDSLLEKYKVDKNDTVLITDTLGDLLESNASGIKSIAVTWGLHKKDTLEKGVPTMIIDSPTELVEVVEKALQ